jgi:aspartyl-tRNA(Asn)/glutamyl-tRNA(Gln) amidotransferase subunit A
MILYKNLSDLQTDIIAGKTTVEKVVSYYLNQIEATEHLNAYVEVFGEEALARARELDVKYKNQPNSIGKLFGAVVSIKDVICYKGHGVTAASKILEGFESIFSATAVERLLAEDAIIIGRTNCDQFGMGSTNENSYYGSVKNGADERLIPGGSSGGAAVAIQVDTCLIALGSDTGGSVRQPAAFCGVVGFKPSYGRISRHGLLAYASSFDQIGILSHSVQDAALALEIMAGSDEFDATSSEKKVEQYSQAVNKGIKRIAYFDTALNSEGMDDEIKKMTLAKIDTLREAGHLVVAVEFEYLDYIIPAYYVLTTAEASSNLSRYDGVRYGYRAKGVKTLDETYRKSRTEGFSEEVKRRIVLGAFVLSSGYYDAYYTKAQKIRRLISDRTLAILKDYDFILMPASPIPAWEIGAKTQDPVSMYLADIFTVQANMVGIPALCIPIGSHSQGGGVGLQFMAAPFEEAALMAFCREI